MKFKIDQNLPTEFVSILQQAGHDALTVFEQQLGGAPDLRVVATRERESRVLMTADLDLSDIREYPGKKGTMIVAGVRKEVIPIAGDQLGTGDWEPGPTT
jgi:predicted nuclease of predicted toxin-antitoxin system